MSKTKKKLFYSAIVAAVILLAFVAVTFMTSMIDDAPVIAESGEGADAVSTKTVDPSSDSGYNALNVRTDMTYPGTFTGMTQQGNQISDAAGLDAALKTGGTYYLTKNISYTASTSSSSAASSGTFSGVLYGNGYTVTVTVPSGSKYSWTTDGSYGFLVKNLSGTIRDLNIVIAANQSNWTKFGFNTSGSNPVSQVDGESAHMQNIGGIAGNMTGGLIHNCSVKYTGYLWLITNGADPAAGNAWSGADMANIFGGVAGRASGGIISYTTVDFTGRVVNAGQQRGDGTNHLMISTGGVVGQVGNGTVYMKKITVQGGGWIASEAYTYSRGMFNYPYTDVLTGGVAGWVSSASNANLQVNGVYLNLTYFSQGADSGAYSGSTASSGNAGGVKSYYAVNLGVNKNAFKSAADSIVNDQAGNISSDAYASEMRTSYGIGAVHQSKTNSVSLNNVYVSSATADIIQKHHPYAAHQIYYGRDTSNTYWNRWNWVYTVVDTATLGTEFAFAPTTSVGNTVNHNTADILNLTNSQRGVYFKVSNQSASRFVYNIKQGTDSVNDLYQIYSKTYNNFGNGGTLWVPAMFAGYTGTVKSEVRGYNTLTDTNSSTVTTYKNTVSAEFGSYLYMDFEMTRSYEGTDRYSDGYTGSGDSYTYTYNGDMLYVPAFAGYKTSYGTGDKVSFTEDELNSIGMSSTNFSLSSSYTITSSQSVNYDHYQWLHWNGAGNVGTYTMNYSVSDTLPKFITKDGNYYYCAFRAEYSPKTVSVVPCELTLNWNTGDMIYDGTGKDVSTAFTGLPSGTSLGNNDGSNLGVTISYSADNENLLIQNKPYHAGDYTATATLTYGETTENVLTGNFTLSNAAKPFTVGKVTMTLTPSAVTSKYGDNHTEALATAGVGVEGNWVGDDASYFDFVVKTVDDTINFATVKGSYPTTVEATLKENATAELFTDYEFSVNQGALVINERPINGVLTISNGVYNGFDHVAALVLEEGVQVSTDKVFELEYVKDSSVTDSAVNAGEYLIRITPEANKYSIGNILIQGKDELYVDGETKLVIEQRSVDVTLSFDNGYVYDGANKVTGYVAQMQEGDAGIIGGESVDVTMSYNGGTQAVMPATYKAIATFSDPNYKAGTIVGGDFTIEKAELADIRIDSASAVYDGTGKSIAYTLVGVAAEQDMDSLVGTQTVTYNKSVSLPVNADVYEVEITVAEGAAYKEKTVSATFTVEKADITFIPVTTTTYTGRNIEPSYSIEAPGMADASSLKNYVSAIHTTILNATSYDVTLEFAGTANYNAKSEKYTLTVQRADLVVEIAEGQTLVYNRKEQAPAYTVSALVDGDAYGEVTVTVSGEKATDGKAVKAGDYTLTISIAESVNYNAVTKEATFTIDQYKISLIGATEQFVTVLKDGGGAEITTIDSYLPYVDVALTDDTGAYDETDLLFTTNPADNLVFADGKAVFTAEITVDGLNTDNYEFTPVTITVNVLDASITITVNGEETTLTSVTFGNDLTIEAKGTYGGNAAEDVQEVAWYSASDGYTSALAGQPTDAGSYMATFRYTFGADSNYVTRALYLTISPKAVTVTLNGSAVNVTYGDEISDASFANASYTTDAGEMNLAIEYTTNAAQYSPTGSYILGGMVVAVTDGNVGNYSFTVVPGTLNVVRKTVYVKADDVEVVYGEEVILSGFTVYSDDGITVWEGYADAAPLKVSLSVQSGILTVGAYDIAVSDNGGNDNYRILSVTEAGKLTVNKRQVQITVNDVDVVYGTSEISSLTGSITSGSLVNGDTLGVIAGEWIGAETLSTLDADTYQITDYMTFSATLVSAQEGINYEITFADTTKLVVSPRSVSIVFVGWQSDGVLGTDNVVTYNAEAWTVSAEVDGIINDDVVEVAVDDATVIKNAGTYTRTLSLSGDDAANYVAEDYVATLEIRPYKTAITVDATSYTYTYGDAKTAINQSVSVLENDTDDGTFVQKYYVGTNTGVTGTQVSWDEVWNAGTYTVVVSYNGGNYTADPVNVTVTVNKKQISKIDPYSDGNLGQKVYDATNTQINASTVADINSLGDAQNFVYAVYMLGDTQVSVIRNAGEYTVDLRMTENVNYEIEGGGESLLNKTATYTVTKAQSGNLNFSLTYANRVYDGSDMTDYIKSVIAISGVNGEPVTGAVLTLTVTDEGGSELAPLNSGVYKISVTATDMTNYEDMTSAYEAGNFTIDKVTVSVELIELPDGTATYDSTVKTIEGQGIQQSAVLRNVSYEYSDSSGFVSDSGVTEAGNYTVRMIILLDKLNVRFSSDVTLDSYVDEVFGEVYKYEATATLVIGQAIPKVNIVNDTGAYYFDGYNHSIEFSLSGVGADNGMTASYDASTGAGQTVTVDGLGTFSVRYYKDSAYSSLLTDGNGAAVLPLTVLADGGKPLPYYAMISFVSANNNYASYDFRNTSNDLTLYIMQSIVTLSFGNLSAPYGQLASPTAANGYVRDNITYTYTVNDEGSNSVNYDPEAMIEISYNLNSFSANVGSYEIAVSAQALKTEYAGSVTVVVSNANNIRLNVTPADLTDDIKAVFTDVSDTYGNKTYTAADFAWTVKDKLNNDVAYVVEYNGATDFSISDAGNYEITVRIPAGNFNEWTGSITLDIAKVGVDVVWTMNGQPAENGTFTMTYNGQPAPVSIEVVDVSGVAANVVYVNSEGAEIDAPYAVGTYSAKAVLDNSNYYVNDSSATATVVIEAMVLDEAAIRGWIKDDSDVYGSVQGIDITGLPEGFGATSIVYTDGTTVYDMTTVKGAKVGTYDATVTVSNGSSSGSATFKYTVTKRSIVFTVSVNTTAGKKITASDVTLRSDKSLATGDTASVSAITFTNAYSEQLAFGTYDMADYVASVTVAFNRNADCYTYSVVMGDLVIAPSAAPEVASVSANYNTVTVKFATEGLYAYRVGSRGSWIEMSAPSDTLIVTGLKADTNYSVYVAYAGFTSVNGSQAVRTTADPAVLSEMIDSIMEGGLTVEKQEQYDSILAYYETIAEGDRAEIQAEYDALVAQFNALGKGGGSGADVLVIVVCSICLVLIVASIAGVVVAAVMKKRRNDNMFRNDGSLV